MPSDSFQFRLAFSHYPGPFCALLVQPGQRAEKPNLGTMQPDMANP